MYGGIFRLPPQPHQQRPSAATLPQPAPPTVDDPPRLERSWLKSLYQWQADPWPQQRRPSGSTLAQPAGPTVNAPPPFVRQRLEMRTALYPPYTVRRPPLGVAAVLFEETVTLLDLSDLDPYSMLKN